MDRALRKLIERNCTSTQAPTAVWPMCGRRAWDRVLDWEFRVKELHMKALVTATLFSGLLCAQPPQPVQVTPGTPAVKAPPQATPATPPAPAAIAPTTIVMEANGKKYTAAEVDHLIAIIYLLSQVAT